MKKHVIVLIVLIGTGFLNEATLFSLFNATQILCMVEVYRGWKSVFSEIFDLSPKSIEVGTFPIALKESHKSAHWLKQRCSAAVITLENGNFESIGCNQVIVLIVLIVTGCLNEAMPYSLFNSTQFLSIPIMDNNRCCIYHPYRHSMPKITMPIFYV